MSEERTSNAGLNWAHGGVLNTTSTTSSDNKFLSVLGRANCSGEHSSSVDGILSFHDQFLSKPDANTSLLNEGLMIAPLNQQNLLLQQNIHSSRMADQVRPPKTIPLLENVPSGPAWVTNPSRMMVDDYIDMPSQIPNFGAGQSGAPIGYTNFGTLQSGPPGFPGFVVRQPCPNKVPMAGLVSYPCPPGAFNIVRTPNQMLGNASTQFNPISQPNSLPGSKYLSLFKLLSLSFCSVWYLDSQLFSLFHQTTLMIVWSAMFICRHFISTPFLWRYFEFLKLVSFPILNI